MNKARARVEANRILKDTWYKKPVKEYRNYTSFLTKPGYRNNQICNICHGTGKVVANGEFCDSVEGYKNAKRVECDNCKGSGNLTNVQIKENYRKYLDGYENKLLEYENKLVEVCSVLEKLELKELNVLKSVL